eukprot:5761872-Pleurochrysis_carterae.AAC.1
MSVCCHASLPPSTPPSAAHVCTRSATSAGALPMARSFASACVRSCALSAAGTPPRLASVSSTRSAALASLPRAHRHAEATASASIASLRSAGTAASCCSNTHKVERAAASLAVFCCGGCPLVGACSPVASASMRSDCVTVAKCGGSCFCLARTPSACSTYGSWWLSSCSRSSQRGRRRACASHKCAFGERRKRTSSRARQRRKGADVGKAELSSSILYKRNAQGTGRPGLESQSVRESNAWTRRRLS